VEAAVEAGVTLFDTADIYGSRGGSETLLGEVLRGRWDEVVIATKFGGDMHDGRERRGSRDYIRYAVEQSLRRLRTDVIDLYQFHFPDPQTPIEETLGALDELVDDGKVRHIGCSNFSAAQVEESEETARSNGLTRFISVQNEYSLLERGIERDVVPVCERLNIGVLPYFPLARGLLTGKYRRGREAPEGSRLAGREDIASDEQWEELQELERFAQDRGLRLVDVAIGGLAAQPMVASVIAGATSPDQIESNVAAAQWQPTPEDLEALDAIVPSPRPR
jgi:aryl-alcohol dehydrogenase-like predicted oxidoreductase